MVGSRGKSLSLPGTVSDQDCEITIPRPRREQSQYSYKSRSSSQSRSLFKTRLMPRGRGRYTGEPSSKRPSCRSPSRSFSNKRRRSSSINRGRDEPKIPEKVLCVNGLSREVSIRSLMACFSTQGEVERASLLMEYRNGNIYGYSRIRMESDEAADLCLLRFNQASIDDIGDPITVERCTKPVNRNLRTRKRSFIEEFGDTDTESSRGSDDYGRGRSQSRSPSTGRLMQDRSSSRGRDASGHGRIPRLSHSSRSCDQLQRRYPSGRRWMQVGSRSRGRAGYGGGGRSQRRSDSRRGNSPRRSTSGGRRMRGRSRSPRN